MNTLMGTTAKTETDGKRLMVLLVEDDAAVGTVVGDLIDEAGYDHVTISDHDEITAAVKRWSPQVVILDGEPRPGGQGRSWEDAAAIRRAHPHLPVLMFTADVRSIAEARAGTSARSKAAGYAGIMDKPFLVSEFLATLRHAVDKARQAAARESAAADRITVFPSIGGDAASRWAPADFFSAAVHELRTPLTSILGQTQLALRYVDADATRARGAIERAVEQARRMNRLIDELLDHARVTSGALSLEVVTFDLGLAVALAVPLYDHGDTPQIALERPPEPVLVCGDPDRVAQIIGNLLDNAVKYSPPGSPITVSVTVVGDEAQVRVEDAGMGIAPDEQERIFAPFYRTARTREIPGTGLGLHISRRLAEQHRGRLWLEKSSDGGSVFALGLPHPTSLAGASA